MNPVKPDYEKLYYMLVMYLEGKLPYINREFKEILDAEGVRTQTVYVIPDGTELIK